MYILAPFSLGNSVHIRNISQYSIYVLFHLLKPESCNLIITDGQKYLFQHFFLKNIHQCILNNVYVDSDVSVIGLYCPIQAVL